MVQKLIPRIQRRIRKELREFRGQLHYDPGDYRRTVILAGTGRSGTTWVQELINCGNDFRIMFEPFNTSKVAILKDWNYRQYLRSSDHREEFLGPAGRILSGQIRHKWIDRYNCKVFPRERLIKDIRIQLILAWIKTHFPEIPIILLLRHPCATAHSKLKLGWATHLEELLVQPQLMEDHLDPFKEVMENARNDFEKHILLWCVENYIPLKQFNTRDILVLFYEHLCRNPQPEIEKITRFIGKSNSHAMLELLRIPSAQSRKDSPVLTGVDPVSSWRAGVSEDQIKRAVEILSVFGLDRIYNQSDLPLVDGYQALELYPTPQAASHKG